MSSVQISIDDGNLTDLLKKASSAIGSTDALMKNLGESLLNVTLERMDREEAPDGSKWQDLNPGYKSGKRGTRMLQEQGMSSGLKGSLTYRVSGNELELGSSKVYAAIHQYGGDIKPVSADRLYFNIAGRVVTAKKVTIPARPYLGIGQNEMDAIENVAQDILAAAFS